MPKRRAGRIWAFSAALAGILLCALVRGVPMAASYALLGALPALLLGELLEQRKSLTAAIGGAWLGVVAAILLAAAAYAHLKHIELVPYFKSQLIQTIQSMTKRVLENENMRSGLSDEELKRLLEHPEVLVEEIPGMILAGTLVLCIIPTAILLRWNPKGMSRRLGIPRDIWRRWRSPEWLIWPALLCGGFLVFDFEPFSAVANNLLKPILIIYFFQGMSILAYFLDSLRLRGPVRAILYSLGILFLTPMIVSFGFFDLWFNFRGRGKKSKDNGENEL